MTVSRCSAAWFYLVSLHFPCILHDDKISRLHISIRINDKKKGKNCLKFLQQISVYYQFLVARHSWCPDESPHKLSAVDGINCSINDIFTGGRIGVLKCAAIMWLNAFFYSHAAHSQSKCCVRTQLMCIFKRRQEFLKCYRFLLHVFWVIFSLLFAARTRSLILSYPHQLAELFPLNLLFVYARAWL